MKYKFIFLLFTSLIFGCSSENKKYNKAATVIQNMVDVTSIAFNDSSYFEQCRAIKLELSEESLIGEVSQIEIFDNVIYILDKKTVSLQVFDSTGKYIHSIGKRGEGPGEYSAINAFYLNSHNHTINMFDPLKLSVHKYDFNGNFIASVQFKDLILSQIVRATPLDNGSLFCFTNPNWHPASGYFIIRENDYSIQEQIYLHPVPISAEISYSILNHPFVYYNKEVHYVSLFSNIIQSYTDGKNLPLYYIDNGKDENMNFLKSAAVETNGNYLHIIKKIIEDNSYTVGFKNIFETDRYICVDFYGKNLLSLAFLLDKKTKTNYHIDKYMKYTPHFGSIVYSYGNTMVRVWQNADIHIFKENLKSGEITNNYENDFLELIEQYGEEDNPVLLLYTMLQ
ncbi:MAG: 6-bladed beta-propeller [Prevotellaceae bacterium]|jgi:hypothetical protein|nr:6-bladed beta-propeller [Prevotellaceae bacterium]